MQMRGVMVTNEDKLEMVLKKEQIFGLRTLKAVESLFSTILTEVLHNGFLRFPFDQWRMRTTATLWSSGICCCARTWKTWKIKPTPSITSVTGAADCSNWASTTRAPTVSQWGEGSLCWLASRLSGSSVLAALAEDPGSIPSTPCCLPVICNSSSRGPSVLFRLMWAPGHISYIDIRTDRHSYT